MLFAVTPGVDVKQLRLRAEALLIELRCADDGGASSRKRLLQWSNCPSGQQAVTWAGSRGPTAPQNLPAKSLAVPKWACWHAWCTTALACMWWKWWPAIQASSLPVRGSAPGHRPDLLRQQAWVNALRQYLQVAGRCNTPWKDVMLDAADTPLVQ